MFRLLGSLLTLTLLLIAALCFGALFIGVLYASIMASRYIAVDLLGFGLSGTSALLVLVACSAILATYLMVRNFLLEPLYRLHDSLSDWLMILPGLKSGASSSPLGAAPQSGVLYHLGRQRPARKRFLRSHGCPADDISLRP